MKSRNKVSSLDLEKVIGLVTCTFNSLNSQLKNTLDKDSRALFLSHFALLAKHEAEVLGSPISEILKDGEENA